MRKTSVALALASFALVASAASGVEQRDDPDSRIPPGSKVFLAPMNGFDTYLIAALTNKNVPLTIVIDRDHADFEIVGVSDSQRPGWVRTLVKGDTGTDEEASIAVKNIRTGVVAFGYAVNLKDSFRGKQSAAESCAKHLKDKIEHDAKTLPEKDRPVVTASSNTGKSVATERVAFRRTITAVIQTDSTEEHFAEVIRSALVAFSIDLRSVGRDTTFEYNIILTSGRTSSGPAAAVVVLDATGRLVVAAARSGFRNKGAASGAAEEAARKL